MAEIKNMEGLSDADITMELNSGAKFVEFQYCFSIIIMTFKRSSNIYFIRADESTTRHSIGYTLITLLFGWWGIPWGPLYSIGSLYSNLNGGRDITQEVINSLNSEKG